MGEISLESTSDDTANTTAKDVLLYGPRGGLRPRPERASDLALKSGFCAVGVVVATGTLGTLPGSDQEEILDMRLRVALDELLPAKAAARELPRALDRLERGEVEQLVITRRNEPRAAVVSVERYEELLLTERAYRNGGVNGNGVEAQIPVSGSAA